MLLTLCVVTCCHKVPTPQCDPADEGTGRDNRRSPYVCNEGERLLEERLDVLRTVGYEVVGLRSYMPRSGRITSLRNKFSTRSKGLCAWVVNITKARILIEFCLMNIYRKLRIYISIKNNLIAAYVVEKLWR